MALKLEILLEAVDRLTAPLERVRAKVAALATPIAAIGSATARLGRAGGIDQLAVAMGRVLQGARQAAGEMLRLTGSAAALAGIGAGVGVAVAGQSAVNAASEMERYRITLTQVEGSAAAAERALTWVSDFATRTPFELGEVTRAFVDIRNLGLDPTRGSLAAAGDAASIMGTSFGEAVTALSAALRGEMDPIERFGIFARTEGENIVMNWEHQGRRMRAVVDKNNREMIAAMVQAAWAQKFGGGMEQLAASWAGMLSNLADAWSRFQLAVMNAGVFDWLKDRLGQLLAAISRMTEDGTLQAWAESIAAGLLRAFNGIETFILGQQRMVDGADGAAGTLVRSGGIFERLGEAVRIAGNTFAWLQGVLTPIIGPFDAIDAVLGSIGLVLAGPLIASLGALVAAFVTLGAALLATPVGWAVAAFGGLAAAGIAIYRNWNGIAAWFSAQWEAAGPVLRGAVQIIIAPLTGLAALARLLIDNWTPTAEFFRSVGTGIAAGLNAAIDAAQRLLDLLPRLPSGGESPTGAVNDPAAQARRRANQRNGGASRIDELGALMGDGAAPSSVTPSAGRVDLGGTLRIRVEDGRVTTNGRLNDPRARLDVDQGLLAASP